MRLVVVMLAVALASMLAFAGCTGCSYGYNTASCTVRCGVVGNDECPAGFGCQDDHFCHASAAEAMCPCIAVTCDDVPGACGDMPDSCGGTNHCGGCAMPLGCGSGGTPFVCGDPADCTPKACAADQCGPITNSCGDPDVCPNCPVGKKCAAGKCVACTPTCQKGELACGDDGCGGTCGSCPDARWKCETPGICCIENGEHCNPLLEGCNCCPGLFCVNGICQPDTGCSFAADRSFPDDDPVQ